LYTTRKAKRVAEVEPFEKPVCAFQQFVTIETKLAEKAAAGVKRINLVPGNLPFKRVVSERHRPETDIVDMGV